MERFNRYSFVYIYKFINTNRLSSTQNLPTKIILCDKSQG